MESPLIGASFSHRHLSELGITLADAWHEYKNLGLKWIRLGCYWDEIEKTEGKYNLSIIKQLLETCAVLKINVVMTIGMKAPRWPEFYIPEYIAEKSAINTGEITETAPEIIADRLFAYIKHTVRELGGYSRIKYWQVENEPLDQSGPQHIKISSQLLRREVSLVRTIDPERPVVINLWGNELTKRNNFPHAVELADVVGLDLYPRVPRKTFFREKYYRRPDDSDGRISNVMKSIRGSGKSVWITELQSEPWGGKDSCTASHVIENAKWAKKLSADAVFFWGFEYWVRENLDGNNSYIEAAKDAFRVISSV